MDLARDPDALYGVASMRERDGKAEPKSDLLCAKS